MKTPSMRFTSLATTTLATALVAVLAPERHDLLFFVARRDGQRGHVFSRTYKEHKAHVRTQLGGP